MSLESKDSRCRQVLLPLESDLTIEVLINGENGRPTVVLLPSSIRSSCDFNDIAERFADAGYLVLRPQFRGISKTQGSLENLTLHTLANDVVQTIQQLGNGEPAILIGHAFGHYVVRVIDLEYPKVVRGIVLAATERRYQTNSSLLVSRQKAANESLPRDERLKGLYEAFFAPNSDASEWLTGWYPHLTSIYSSAGKIPSKDVWWPVSNSPILDLQASDDPWRPAESRNELKDALGDKVTVRVIEGASHALFPEQSERVFDAIINWIETLNSKS